MKHWARDKGGIALDEQGEYLFGPALYERARELGGDKMALSFSRGKDSIAMWLELREHFEIFPYYCYMVPGGLSYELDSLAYYEEFFGQHIARFTHPIFWKNINDLVFQPPDRVRIIRTLDYPNHEAHDIARVAGMMYGLEDHYTAYGYRAADDPRRRILALREGPLGDKGFRYFWPIWDWNIEQVSAKLHETDVMLSLDYALWGRTLTAIDYQYGAAIRDTCPDDWEKLCFWYPLLEAEMYRYEGVGS